MQETLQRYCTWSFQLESVSLEMSKQLTECCPRCVKCLENIDEWVLMVQTWEDLRTKAHKERGQILQRGVMQCPCRHSFTSWKHSSTRSNMMWSPWEICPQEPVTLILGSCLIDMTQVECSAVNYCHTENILSVKLVQVLITNQHGCSDCMPSHNTSFCNQSSQRPCLCWSYSNRLLSKAFILASKLSILINAMFDSNNWEYSRVPPCGHSSYVDTPP